MSIFLNHFFLEDLEYYYYNAKYYVDNGTVRQSLTREEYNSALIDYLNKPTKTKN